MRRQRDLNAIIHVEPFRVMIQLFRLDCHPRHPAPGVHEALEFEGLLNKGRYWFSDPLNRIKVQIVSQRDVWLMHRDLDIIVKSDVLEGRATVLDLKDRQRALVWIDGRFARVLGPGLYALWTKVRDVRIELVDAGEVRFNHKDLNIIAKSDAVEKELDFSNVEPGFAGVYFKDGAYVETLGPGR